MLPKKRNSIQSEISFLFCVVIGLFFLFAFWHIIYTYFLRSQPQFYTVQDPSNPLLHHLRRIVPFREWLRKVLDKPRSGSDVHRDEEFERVRAALDARGWRGRVRSDGTPDLDWGREWGYDEDVEYGPRQYIEREDTSFWQSGRRYDTFSRPATIPSSHHQRHQIPGASPSATANSAQFSYQVSPRGTNFVTPPARASRNILGLPVNSTEDVTTLTFPHADLTRHYESLCALEACAWKDGNEADIAEAMRKRREFGDRFSVEANIRSKKEQPPPYSEIEPDIFEEDYI